MLAPFYWAEALSDEVECLFRNEVELAISQLVEVELFSALSRRVRMGEIEREEALLVVERFQTDLEDGFYRRIMLEPAYYTTARDWISQFATPLRTFDALHLAIAAATGMPLITADKSLSGSAE
ncbi:MAG TPA: type II toxin-antitoxin system VapC family toxin, partial [Crinalium sp.]